LGHYREAVGKRENYYPDYPLYGGGGATLPPGSDYGRIMALDTPRDLIAKQNLESAVEFTTSNSVAKEFFQELPKVSKVTQHGDRFTLHTKEASSVLTELTRLSG